MSEEITAPQGENQEDVSAADNSAPATEPVDNADDTAEVKEPVSDEQKEPPKEEPVNEDKKLEDVDTSDDAQVADFLGNKGFDLEKLQEEFNQYGDITPETREALAKIGITEEILDGYIEGRIAIVEKQMNEIADYIGGQEAYESIRNWAKENLSEKEKAAIDKIHDPDGIKCVLDGLKARMEASDGVIPQQLTGEGTNVSSDLFESLAEMQAAIRDPRYSKDEAYREKIAKKITASRVAGKINFN